VLSGGGENADFGTVILALPFGVFHFHSRATSGRGNPLGSNIRWLKSLN
jgi:hypothetical protein